MGKRRHWDELLPLSLTGCVAPSQHPPAHPPTHPPACLPPYPPAYCPPVYCLPACLLPACLPARRTMRCNFYTSTPRMGTTSIILFCSKFGLFQKHDTKGHVSNTHCLTVFSVKPCCSHFHLFWILCYFSAIFA